MITSFTRDAWMPEAVSEALLWQPRTELGKITQRCLEYLPAGLAMELLERITQCVVLESRLYGAIVRASGLIEDYGLVSQKVVSQAGANFIAQKFANNTPADIALFNFHGLGTNGTAESSGQSALITELTTQYQTDNTRPAGTRTMPLSYIYQTECLVIVDAPVTALEHAVLTQAATGGGVMLDRSVINATLGVGDGYRAIYQLSINSGG